MNSFHCECHGNADYRTVKSRFAPKFTQLRVMTLRVVMKMGTKWFWSTAVTGGPPERATDGLCMLDNAQRSIKL